MESCTQTTVSSIIMDQTAVVSVSVEVNTNVVRLKVVHLKAFSILAK